ncbi:MAG: hypothetical protein GX257_08780 [Clostridiales bacterium]|jgi:hypothetical protein|nr:hypothetical protein [Clostridiales bacterium]
MDNLTQEIERWYANTFFIVGFDDKLIDLNRERYSEQVQVVNKQKYRIDSETCASLTFYKPEGYHFYLGKHYIDSSNQHNETWKMIVL